MDHDDIRHKLSEYLDSSMTDQEHAEIEEHLKTCQECGEALTELKKTIEHIKTIEAIEPPIWMAQKIMAKVRAEAEQKKNIFERLFFPRSIRLPIQAVAVVFLAVTAFYIYQNIQPMAKYAEAPLPTTQEFATKKEPAPIAGMKRELNKADGSSLRSKQAAQTPGFTAQDIKQEYEKPSLPLPKDQLAASAPTKAAEQLTPEKKGMMLERRTLAPHALGKVKMREQTTSAAGTAAPAEAKSESIASLKVAKKLADKTKADSRLENDILERHPNGKPKLVITYEIIDSKKIKRAEERFNADGERHGIQKEYYASGQLKVEAQYGYGKLQWYMEFDPNGVKKIGKSSYDWFWLLK